jgi:hypothetical protein
MAKWVQWKCKECKESTCLLPGPATGKLEGFCMSPESKDKWTVPYWQKVEDTNEPD